VRFQAGFLDTGISAAKRRHAGRGAELGYAAIGNCESRSAMSNSSLTATTFPNSGTGVRVRYSSFSFDLTDFCTGEMVGSMQQGWDAVIAVHAQYKLSRSRLI